MIANDSFVISASSCARASGPNFGIARRNASPILVSSDMPAT